MKNFPFGAVFSVLSIGSGYRVESIIGAFCRPGIEFFISLMFRTASKKLLFLLAAFTISLKLFLYVLNSVSLKKIADRLKVSNPYLAWVPIANQYIVGSVAFYKNRIKTILYTLTVNLFSVFSIIIDLVCYFGGEDGTIIFYLFWSSYLLNIVVFILCVITRYKIYSMFSEKAKVLTSVDIFLSIRLSSIFMYLLRKKEFIDDKYFEVSKQK